MQPEIRENEVQGESKHQVMQQRCPPDEHLTSEVIAGHDIPTAAVPAFWDELPDLSRYSQSRQLIPPSRLSAPKENMQATLLTNQNRIPSSTRMASQNLCPQPSSGSILDLKRSRLKWLPENRRNFISSDTPVSDVASSLSKGSPVLRRPRANSDLKDIYTSQQRGSRPPLRPRSKIFAALRRHNPSPNLTPSPLPPPSIENDCASLPSQLSKGSRETIFEEIRKISLSGALRRKEMGESNVTPDFKMQLGPTEIAHDIPTPPPEMIDRLHNSKKSSPTIRKRSLRKFRYQRDSITIIDPISISAPTSSSHSAPTSPILESESLPKIERDAFEPHQALQAYGDNERELGFSQYTSFRTPARNSPDLNKPTSSTGEIDTDEIISKGLPRAMDSGAVDDALEEEAAAHAGQFRSHNAGLAVKKQRRMAGDFSGFRFPDGKKTGAGCGFNYN